tara:strand:+ start:216 stop:1172 length:957 start_codon:yes stop_codon:yes gene_type:complete
MPPYTCYFCHNSFSQKGVLRNHFNNIKKCEFKKYDDENNLKTEISRDDMILLFEIGEYENLFLDIKLHPKDSKKTPKRLQKDSKKTPNGLQRTPKSIKCEYCGLEFTRMNNKNRHIREKRCKFLKNNSEIFINNNQNIVNNNQKITNNNIQNNIQNNVNIQINGYGKENLSYITKDILEDIINKPLSGIPKLIEMIHLNPEHPENSNIKLVNKNLPFLNYYNGDFWKTGDKSTVLGNLLKSKTEITDKFYENSDIENKTYPKYSDAVRYVVNNFEFEDPLVKYRPSKKVMKEIYKKLEKDLYRMILNHRDYVKDICET